MYSMPIRRALGASLQAGVFTIQRDRAHQKDKAPSVRSMRGRAPGALHLNATQQS